MSHLLGIEKIIGDSNSFSPFKYNEEAELSHHFLTGSEDWNRVDLVEAWDSLIEGSANLNLLYQSRDWWDHLKETEPHTKRLIYFCKRDSEKILCLAPLIIDRFRLKFYISAKSIYEVKMKGAYILGSEPIIDYCDNSHLYKIIFNTLFEHLAECDCIYLDSISSDGYLWEFLLKRRDKQDRYRPYVLSGRRAFHAIEFPRSLNEYLLALKGRKRNDMKRRVKLLRNHCGGSLELMRFDSKGQISNFLTWAGEIGQDSWQIKRMGSRIDNSAQWAQKINDLAGRGLLRSYILLCGGSPLAFVLGYQYRRVYHYVEVGYRQSFKHFSPGIVLLYLLLQDLYAENPPQSFNFGVGDANYKKEFANVHREDASILLLRNSWGNRLIKNCHAGFRTCVEVMKWGKRHLFRAG